MKKEDLDKMELTSDFLYLNFVEDKETPHFNIYPNCMCKTNRYFISMQRIGSCDCGKQLSVYNYENKIEAKIEDDNHSTIDQMARPFTVGDLRTLLNLTGLNDLADNLMTEEDITNEDNIFQG